MDKEKRVLGQCAIVAALVLQTVSGVLDAQASGPVAAYSFDEGSGVTCADASGNGNVGAVAGATWTAGRFGSALLFDGVDDLATVQDSASLDLTTGMTLEAWVLPVTLTDWRTIILKERPGHLSYAIYGNTDSNRPSGEAWTSASGGDARGTAPLSLNTWTHVAVTYDGATLRFFIDGVEVSSRALSGSIIASADPLRIGGNTVWGEHFSGRIDELRIYDRALTAVEIQQDMTTPVARDTAAPTVTSVTPPPGAPAAHPSVDVSAAFSEAMDAATITNTSVSLRDLSGALVPSAVRYDAATRSAVLDPADPLAISSPYTAIVRGGANGVKDTAGLALAADYVWTFTTTADADTPFVVSRSPAPAAINVATSVAIDAVFSESLDPASIGFGLRTSTGTGVAATLSYEPTTRTARLRPNAPLAEQTTYTATVSSARDVAGNAMAAPLAWNFTTGTTGFRESIVVSGLIEPTAVEFASDGRVFVAEKSGIIKVFDGLSDTTPTVFADLRSSVHNFWDRGLLGMALDPQFPARPYVYVLYAYDAAIGGAAPRWGAPDATSDPCPTPPGATEDGCVVSGRLSRLEALGNVQNGAEQVLIEDWGQQFPSHSVGHLAFGPDGALYVTGGDGASFTFTDYGQTGDPLNPLGDPPVSAGSLQAPPSAEGGALRAQDVRTSSDPAGLGGSVIRIHPDTGAAMPGNPLATSADANAARIIAHGLRNPFRFAFRPGTSELYVGDVGWSDFEEINRIADATASPLINFGWPCYEGTGRQSGYDAANLAICESLYSTPGAVAAPYYAYAHRAALFAGDSCGPGSSSVSGLAFYESGRYPAKYAGALFLADYSRNCIWTMLPGADGRPSPSRLESFLPNASGPVQLKTGPGGDLFYVALGGSIRRIQYFDGSRPPVASLVATPATGRAPLTVTFDASGSGDPDVGDQLTYAWDLDGDGLFDDGSTGVVTFTYSTAGVHQARLRVSDTSGLSAVAATDISVGSAPPAARIVEPASTLKWRVGDPIVFSGSAVDPEDGALPAAAYEWLLVMQHCSTLDSCHAHPVQTFSGVTGGSFVAQDHEYPSYLELSLTVTDSSGLQSAETVRLDPQTVVLAYETEPAGLSLAVGSTADVAPFTRTVIVGSTNSISAPAPQSLGGTAYDFLQWSDGGAQAHDIAAPETPATYRATFAATPLLSISDAAAVEADTGDASLAFTVALGAASVRTVAVNYAVTGSTATAGVDFIPSSGTLTFAPGVTTQVLAIPVLADARDEANETVIVTLSVPVNAAIADGEGVGTIADDDPPVSISVDDVEVSEGSGGTATAVFTVSLSAMSELTVSVDYATAAATAAAPADFASRSGTLVFLPGSLRATVAVPIQGDLVDEPDETFVLNLSGAVNGVMTDAQGVATIRDDDLQAAPALVAAYGFEEDAGALIFDASGFGHSGTISGATRTLSGRFGRALRFDGINDLVTVADSTLLDLSAAMTLEAWILPGDVRQNWRPVLVKERPGGDTYAMFASSTSNVPSGAIETATGTTQTRGPSRLITGTWTHLAVTYDGVLLRLYVNGLQMSARAVSGNILTSSGALRIGGDVAEGEYFEGFIDEVRIYNKALTAGEIQADMATPVQGGTQ